MTLIYIAGPLFNTHERGYLEHIASVLEGAGYQTFLPHRDAGLLGQITLERRNKVFDADLEALEKCDLIVELLTGPDQDSGTCAELGYCKPCYGITNDFRWMNNFIWGICNDGDNIAKSAEELVEKLKET